MICDWDASGYELNGVAQDMCDPLNRGRGFTHDTRHCLAAPGLSKSTGKEMGHASSESRPRRRCSDLEFDPTERSTSAPIALAPLNGHAKHLPATVELLSAASVPAVRVAWLWEGWLARGKVHLLASSPGTGKTQIAVSFCRRSPPAAGGRMALTLKRAMADLVRGGWPCRCAGAAVSADRGRSQAPPFIHDVTERGQARPVDAALDMPKPEAACRALPALRLIALDPVVAAVSGEYRKNTETGGGFSPSWIWPQNSMAASALRTSAEARAAASRWRAWRARSLSAPWLRIVLATVKPADPDAPRRLVRAKSNLGPVPVDLIQPV